MEPAKRVQFAFSEEQEQFRETVRRFLKEKSPTTAVRRLMETDTGYDPAVWSALSTELALPGVHIPEEYGGGGFGMVELCLATEELGRALLCAPYFSTAVLAANTILNAGTGEQKSTLLPDLAAGARLATLAVTEPNGDWDPRAITTKAEKSNGGYRLTGTKSYVVDGHITQLLIVAARLPDKSLALFITEGDAAGVTRRLLKTMDPTRKLAQLGFNDTPAQVLGAAGTGEAALIKTLDQAAVALANEMVGGAQALFDDTIGYVKMRVQFGRPIGSFQAIKHRCADLLTEIELAKSTAYYAAQAAAIDDKEWPALASMAKAAAADAYLHAAIEAIQFHGGIGFTWDNDTHLWFKRAKSSEVFLGSPNYHRELLMQRWGV